MELLDNMSKVSEKNEKDLIAEDYSYDYIGQHEFEGLHSLPKIASVAIYLSLVILFYAKIISNITLTLVSPLFAFIFMIIALIISYSIPKSRITGKPLLKFKNSSPECKRRELLYVDVENKTYFKMRF
jgi:hypothetical protein